MSMFPIFMLGFIVGIAISYAWYLYKKDVPSEIKIRLQQAKIVRYKSDIEELEKSNKELQEEITKLKQK